LRNTDWIIGIVVYTGPDTKIFRNSKNPPHKVSNMMRRMNNMLYQVFALQILIIISLAGLNLYWAINNNAQHPETGKTSSDIHYLSSHFILQILSFWVTFSHMIPISLYVAIEVLKLSQSLIIGRDVKMYDPETRAFA
jgi:magnesium-transporting ATPase (P-type)